MSALGPGADVGLDEAQTLVLLAVVGFALLGLIDDLLGKGQIKAAYAIAEKCGVAMSEVQSLFVERATQLLTLGLYDEAASTIAITEASGALAWYQTLDTYAGKQMTIVASTESGSGYDLYARLVARHLGRHIPGQPLIVPRNMPGAGSRSAATWVHNIAPRDGTVLATATSNARLVESAKALR